MNILQETKVCVKCKEEKGLDRFPYACKQTKRLRTECKSCCAKVSAARYVKKTPEEKLRTDFEPLAHSKIYLIWGAMKTRCSNPNHESYKHYGARGIKVCDRWQKFRGFFEDMGFLPEGYSLDRIDNDGDYCPENCRWASATTQARNKRTSKYITWEGRTLTIQEWAELTGKSYSVLTYRLKRGWSLDRVFTQKIKEYHQ